MTIQPTIVLGIDEVMIGIGEQGGVPGLMFFPKLSNDEEPSPDEAMFVLAFANHSSITLVEELCQVLRQVLDDPPSLG